MKDIPKVEDILILNIFQFDIDFIDGNLIDQLARRKIQKYDKSVNVLSTTIICHVNNMNAIFKAFGCKTGDTIFSNTGKLERHLITCNEHVKQKYPKNAYDPREALLEKLDAINIP